MLFMLATLASLLFVIQTLCLKQLPKPRSSRSLLGLIAAYSSIIAGGLCMWLLINEAGLAISKQTWGYGSLYGVVFVLAMYAYTKAMNSGPLSYSAFYFSVSLMVPVLASMTIWQEPAGIGKLIGIALFLLSFYFIQIFGSRTDGQKEQGSRRWIVYCMIAFLFNGLIPVLAKAHQFAVDGQEAVELMFVGFLTAFVCAALFGTLLSWSQDGRRKFNSQHLSGNQAERPPFGTLYQIENNRNQKHFASRTLLLLFGIALTTGIGNILITYLSTRLPGAYLFPFVNGSMIVWLTLLSAFVFKEKLTIGGLLGIATGVIAIVVVNL